MTVLFHRGRTFEMALVAGLSIQTVAPGAGAKGLDCDPAPAALPAAVQAGPDRQTLDDAGRLADTVTRMRSAGMTDLEVVDGLVNAYCRDVARQTQLSFHDQTLQVRALAARVTPLVYGSDNESAILVDLPLPPKTLAEVDRAARLAGQSRASWLRKAIAAALGQP